jgi:hypothetical protein
VADPNHLQLWSMSATKNPHAFTRRSQIIREFTAKAFREVLELGDGTG